jgi:hypothetical protein
MILYISVAAEIKRTAIIKHNSITKQKITTSIYGMNVVTLVLVAAENAVDEMTAIRRANELFEN